MSRKIPTGEECEYFTQCSTTNFGTPPCPVTKLELQSHLNTHPLLPAEQLCIASINQVGLKPGRDQYKNSCTGVLHTLDTLLARSTHDLGQSIADFREMEEDIATILNSKDNFHLLGRETYHAQICTIQSFLPAFYDRIRGTNVSKESALKVHDNICNLLQNFNSTYINTTPRKNRVAIKHMRHIEDEWSAIGLLTRLGNGRYFPWPPTAREEASASRSEHNHDFYCFGDTLTKVPIQVKRSKRGSGYKGVVNIAIYDILRAIRESAQTDERKSTSIPNVPDMLIAEHRGTIAQDERNCLNLASMYIISRIDGHEKFKRKPPTCPFLPKF